MAQFRINKLGQILLANDFAELLQMAKNGVLEPSDLIQPQGSSEWLYAGELPNIKDFLSVPYEEPQRDNKILGIALLLVSFALFYVAYQYQQEIPNADDLELVGDKVFQEDQAMLTKNSEIFSDPEGRTRLGTLDNQSIVTLLDKKGEFFQVESSAGKGWVSMYSLAPAYLFAGAQIRDKYDARFNAHRRIKTHNASWEREGYDSDITMFFLQLQNLSLYPVEDMIVQLDVKGSNGKIMQTEIIKVEGILLDGDSTMIGTLLPTPKTEEQPRILTRNKLLELAKKDPTVTERWIDHVRLSLGQGKLGGAIITVTQANAIIKTK